MKTKTCFYPNTISRNKRYCVRFQTNLNDNTLNCWLNGFGSNFANERVPFEKAGQCNSDSGRDIKNWMKNEVFIGDGVLTLLSYDDAVKIDAELKKLAANGTN